MKQIFTYLKPYRGQMLLGVLLIAVSGVCSLLLPTIMSDILNRGVYRSDWDYILRCSAKMLVVTVISLWWPERGSAPGWFPVSAPTCGPLFSAG